MGPIMNDRQDTRQAQTADLERVGLCARCRHARVITSDRGHDFWMCERSRTDPAYPRYPPLPVRQCPGYEPAAE
jgi:hypothetical protein